MKPTLVALAAYTLCFVSGHLSPSLWSLVPGIPAAALLTWLANAADRSG